MRIASLSLLCLSFLLGPSWADPQFQHGGLGNIGGNYYPSSQVIPDLIQIRDQVESEILRDLTQFVQSQLGRAPDRTALELQLKRDINDKIQIALRSRFGTQAVRGSNYYSLVNGRFSSTPNYSTQDLDDLKSQIESKVLRQLDNTLRGIQGGIGGVIGSATTPRPYQPLYPTLPYQTTVPPYSQISSIISRVETLLNDYLNRVLQEVRSKYFEWRTSSGQRPPSHNWDAILRQLQEDLRGNISQYLNSEIARHYGNNRPSQNVRELDEFKRNIENSLSNRLSAEFNRQKDVYLRGGSASGSSNYWAGGTTYPSSSYNSTYNRFGTSQPSNYPSQPNYQGGRPPYPSNTYNQTHGLNDRFGSSQHNTYPSQPNYQGGSRPPYPSNTYNPGSVVNPSYPGQPSNPPYGGSQSNSPFPPINPSNPYGSGSQPSYGSSSENIDWPSLQRQVYQELSSQLQKAITGKKNQLTLSYRRQAIEQQLSAELSQNVTKELNHQLSLKNYRSQSHDPQLESLKRQLESDLQRQLQQNLQHNRRKRSLAEPDLRRNSIEPGPEKTYTKSNLKRDFTEPEDKVNSAKPSVKPDLEKSSTASNADDELSDDFSVEARVFNSITNQEEGSRIRKIYVYKGEELIDPNSKRKNPKKAFKDYWKQSFKAKQVSRLHKTKTEQVMDAEEPVPLTERQENGVPKGKTNHPDGTWQLKGNPTKDGSGIQVKLKTEYLEEVNQRLD